MAFYDLREVVVRKQPRLGVFVVFPEGQEARIHMQQPALIDKPNVVADGIDCDVDCWRECDCGVVFDRVNGGQTEVCTLRGIWAALRSLRGDWRGGGGALGRGERRLGGICRVYTAGEQLIKARVHCEKAVKCHKRRELEVGGLIVVVRGGR